MEMSLSRKHDAKERFQQDNAEMDEDQLQDELKTVSKQMDEKRKVGLKKLKKRLNDITQDDEMHASVRLQKLYGETEITDFMEELLRWTSYPTF